MWICNTLHYKNSWKYVLLKSLSKDTISNLSASYTVSAQKLYVEKNSSLTYIVDQFVICPYYPNFMEIQNLGERVF
jgi:hypothetical protein